MRITKASRYQTSHGRSSSASYITVSTSAKSKGFCRKVNVDSNNTGAQPTWYLPPTSYRRCQQMRTHPYTTFVDFTKAFDTVNRKGLWKMMQKFGFPQLFMHMVSQLHDGVMVRVTDNGAISEAFAVANGAKYGCVLTRNLFSLMSSAMLMDARRDGRPGIRITYRTDGYLLNSWRTQAPTRLSTATVHDLLFADDNVLSITTKEDMQRSMDLLAAGGVDFGLTISTDKTVVMHQPLPNTRNSTTPRITVYGNQLKIVNN
nr:unnamed protein product [Spirometra erinaceieuropaei]